jgi:predicted CXXCH cytochrome family protein
MRISFLLPATIAWLCLAALPLHAAGPQSAPTSVRDFDAACAKCHGEIYRQDIATPMARASGLATDRLIPGTLKHVPSATEYRVALENGQAVLSRQREGAAQTAVTLPLSYFLGSGHLAVTYLYSIDRFLFESPVAWYASSKAYDMKPGLAEMRQTPPALIMQSACLRCHMSAVQPSAAGTLNRYDGLPFLHSGITCEACHGDASGHVAKGGKGGVVNPARLTADQRDSICISCHLEGDVTVDRAGHSVLDYRPGESISDYLAFYVYGGANPTSRGVSEVEQFAQSHCKQASGDAMSCTSCHDPHFTPQPQQFAAFYRSKCLACHSQPQFAATHHSENQDCTSCHMPRSGAENIPHVAWTDHRILKLADNPKTAPRAYEKAALAPIFSSGATERDLAMANYKAMLEGNASLEPRTWELLQEERGAIQNDKDALDAWGVMCAERGDAKMAEQAFQRVLELDPADLTALSDLGTLQAKQGDLKEADVLLQTAFERNQDISGLAMNLARVQCMSGDAAAARATLETTLVYNPELPDVRRLLAQLTDCAAASGKR